MRITRNHLRQLIVEELSNIETALQETTIRRRRGESDVVIKSPTESNSDDDDLHPELLKLKRDISSLSEEPWMEMSPDRAFDLALSLSDGDADHIISLITSAYPGEMGIQLLEITRVILKFQTTEAKERYDEESRSGRSDGYELFQRYVAIRNRLINLSVGMMNHPDPSNLFEMTDYDDEDDDEMLTPAMLEYKRSLSYLDEAYWMEMSHDRAFDLALKLSDGDADHVVNLVNSAYPGEFGKQLFEIIYGIYQVRFDEAHDKYKNDGSPDGSLRKWDNWQAVNAAQSKISNLANAIRDHK